MEITSKEVKDTEKKKRKACLTVNLTNCKYDIVRECSLNFGCKVVEDPVPWLLYWIDTGVSVERVLEMKPFQRINHFPGMHEICRKDCLARNLGRLSRAFPKDYRFFPKTWILPQEWSDFKRHFRPKKHQSFIAKPDTGCQGKGIFLFKTPDQVASLSNQDLIIQNYVHNPYLLDGYKFDLRVYVLVTSASPLRVFIYQDGLARFATDSYIVPTEKNMANLFMHLTNYAINKHSTNFVHDEHHGSKRSIQSVFRQLSSIGIDTVALWNRICDVVVKTLLTVQPQLSREVKSWFPSNPSASLSGLGSQCFEILGFDILLDQKLKPWVLEVNHSPSFGCDSPLDTEIKTGVITDALNLLNINPSYLKKIQRVEKGKSQTRLWKSTSLNNSTTSITTKKPVLPEIASDHSSPSSDDGKQSPIVEVNVSDFRPRSAMSMNGRQSALDFPEFASEKGDCESSSEPETELDDPNRPDNPTPSASSDSSKTTKKMVSKHKDALDDYLSRYNAMSLEKLTELEDANNGMYKRVFPPDDMDKLSYYLYLMKQTANWSSETVTTKARREFLLKKQLEVEQKLKKKEEWKIRRSNFNVRSKVDTILDRSLLSHKSTFDKPLVSQKKKYEFMYKLDAAIDPNPQSSMIGRSISLRSRTPPGKESLPLKLNYLSCSPPVWVQDSSTKPTDRYNSMFMIKGMNAFSTSSMLDSKAHEMNQLKIKANSKLRRGPPSNLSFQR